MSYSLVTPCNNFPCTPATPEGQGDCVHKDSCLDKCKLEEAIYSIHCMGDCHKGGGTIILDCFNKKIAEPETTSEQ
jgi:hypothetical protein